MEDNTQAQPEIANNDDVIDIPLPSERFDLSFIGDDWKGAYIEYLPFTGYEVEQMQNVDENSAIGTLYDNAAKAIVGGKIPSRSGELKDINKQNFRSIPHKYILKFYKVAVSGEVNENLEK